VGAAVGAAVGATVGDAVGAAVGEGVGEAVGANVGSVPLVPGAGAGVGSAVKRRRRFPRAEAWLSSPLADSSPPHAASDAKPTTDAACSTRLRRRTPWAFVDARTGAQSAPGATSTPCVPSPWPGLGAPRVIGEFMTVLFLAGRNAAGVCGVVGGAYSGARMTLETLGARGHAQALPSV
jgi:hypothetical protein